jgi:predicted MFS family arabinose efflux permease
MSYLLLTIGCILAGPSKILQIPYPDNEFDGSVIDYKKLLYIVGIIFLGTAAGLIVTPLLVEVTMAIKDSLGPLPGSNEKGSALFTLCAGTGVILSMTMGGIFYELFGNRITCDIFGFLSLSAAIIVFVLKIKPGYLLT